MSEKQVESNNKSSSDWAGWNPISILNEEMDTEELLYETSETAAEYNRVKYGILGIIKIIRMTRADQDFNALALGKDLTSLGLNLNASGCIYAKFANPWTGQENLRNNHFSLPQCYYPIPTVPKPSNLSKFDDATMFYIFYNMPQDIFQAYAALTLHERNWFYHKKWTKWLRPQTACDPSGTTIWKYFEPLTWTYLDHTGEIDSSQFMTDAEFRDNLKDISVQN